ncbi:hypothetical protein N9057_03855 [Akkermansiaceae bacterium]|nr:hypothetical protein [bacterium]MDB4465402.1 hypothetical protein [Akkermansiaceae bacterium]
MVKQKLRDIFLLACCLLVAVGPFNVLQTIAWGNMLHDYSSERTFSEAAGMTFSGEYPCEMCRRIAQAKFQESENQRPKPFPTEERLNLRLDFSLEREDQDIDLRWLFGLASPSPSELNSLPPSPRYLRVPTPPPQV